MPNHMQIITALANSPTALQAAARHMCRSRPLARPPGTLRDAGTSPASIDPSLCPPASQPAVRIGSSHPAFPLAHPPIYWMMLDHPSKAEDQGRETDIQCVGHHACPPPLGDPHRHPSPPCHPMAEQCPTPKEGRGDGGGAERGLLHFLRPRPGVASALHIPVCRRCTVPAPALCLPPWAVLSRIGMYLATPTSS